MNLLLSLRACESSREELVCSALVEESSLRLFSDGCEGPPPHPATLPKTDTHTFSNVLRPELQFFKAMALNP